MNTMNFRSPNYYLILPVIVIIMLTYKYWHLSSENAEQFQEISVLHAEVEESASVHEKSFEAMQKDINSRNEKQSQLIKEVEQGNKQFEAVNAKNKELAEENVGLREKLSAEESQLQEQISQREAAEIALQQQEQQNKLKASPDAPEGGEEKKPREQGGKEEKPGEQNGEEEKPGEQNGEEEKPGEQGGEEEKPGEQPPADQDGENPVQEIPQKP